MTCAIRVRKMPFRENATPGEAEKLDSEERPSIDCRKHAEDRDGAITQSTPRREHRTGAAPFAVDVTPIDDAVFEIDAGFASMTKPEPDSSIFSESSVADAS